jgi:glycerate dehydrogenase
MATGYNVIDCAYAKLKNISVSNVPSYSTESVVQAVFSLLLEVVIGTGYHNDTVKRGQWTSSRDFCYYRPGMSQICGKTLGIVGYGRIGKRVEQVARAFGMNVLVYNGKKEDIGKSSYFVALETLLADSDIISLNCPLTADNKGMINAGTISLMKPGAIIINTARGPLINERDLADALNKGRIRGAGLDVLSVEPPPADNPLLKAKNTVITPHIAWATVEARSRLMDILVSNVAAFIRGEEQNIVNK